MECRVNAKISYFKIIITSNWSGWIEPYAALFFYKSPFIHNIHKFDLGVYNHSHILLSAPNTNICIIFPQVGEVQSFYIIVWLYIETCIHLQSISTLIITFCYLDTMEITAPHSKCPI